jgi:hypothetical protein
VQEAKEMKKITTFLLSTVFLSKTPESEALHRVVEIALFLIIFSGFSPYAAAGMQEKQGISKIVQRADIIVRGKVISTESQWKEDHRGRHIYTNVTVTVLDKIKGNIKEDVFTFEVVGGIVGDIGEIVSDTPAFAADEDAVVFLGGQPLKIRGGINGKVPIYGGKIYRDDSGITADSFIQAIRVLEQDPNSPVSFGEKYQELTEAAAQCYLYSGIKWCEISPSVTYKINQNTSDCTGEGAAVQAAATSWNNTSADFTFVYGGSHTKTSASQNFVNEIMWGTMPESSIVAEATVWYYTSTNCIVECDIVFNDPDYSWSSTTPTSSQMDVQTIGLHELGHWLNLGDLYQAEDSGNVMYGYVSFGEIRRTLQPCDIDGICYIYGGCAAPDLYDEGEDYRSFSPMTIQGGQDLSISCDVRNGGTAYSGSFVVKFYASLDTSINTSDYYIGQKSMSGISAGDRADCDWSGSFPSSIPVGVYWVGWIIDADNNVLESDENNNTAYKQGYRLTVVQTYTLTVASSNPDSGVSITVSPNDKTGQGSGTTEFTRTYDNGTVVTLTAPSTAGSNHFQKWRRDYVDYSTNPTATVTMDASYTMTAVYIAYTPPQAQDGGVTTTVNAPVIIALQATDDGHPAPPAALTYVIMSLPSHGYLNDPYAGPITEPCVPLVDYGNQVEYVPDTGYVGQDNFTFVANDGGTAPEGGGSNEATVWINVTDCIFFDDFQSTTLDGSNWPETSGTPVVDDTGGDEPGPPYSLHLEAADSVASKMVDLYGCHSARLQYWWKRVNTEPSDGFLVDYWDGNEWQSLGVLSGGVDTSWELNSVELPSAALHPEFRLSFRAESDSTDDEWYIDGVCIQCESCVDPPVLHPEPNTTEGQSNTIYWDAVAGADGYYAECARDSNFSDIGANSGWIADTNYEFSGLALDQTYWYHVKTRMPFLSKTWLQTSQTDFAADTLTNTIATSDGNVVLSSDIGVSVVDTVGGTTSHIANHDYLNCFYVTDGTTLNQIEVYLGISTSMSIEFVVYEGGASFYDQYNRIFSLTVASSGTGTKFYSSGPVYIPIQAGKHYMIGAICSGTVTSYYKSGHTSPSFGSHVGYGYYNGFPSPSVLTNTSSAAFAFYHRYTSGVALNYEGDIVSVAINLPTGGNWQTVNFSATTPVDTELTVDILPAAGSTPIAGYEGVPSGTDSSAIGETTIRLRANLFTTDANNTPILHDWSISYANPALACESNWSNKLKSTQVGPLGPSTVDLNNDGIPNFYDFSYFAMFWQNAMCLSPSWCEGSDFDRNGVVDIDDLRIFAEFWLWPVDE